MPTRFIQFASIGDLLRVVLILGTTTLLSACLLFQSPAEKGAALFRRERCIDCHGVGGVGSANGPTIANLQSNWTIDKLIEFIADPENFRTSDARLDQLSIEANNRMTPFAHLPESDRRALATYLLQERP